MCESCAGIGLKRRDFLAINGVLGASVVLTGLTTTGRAAAEVAMPPLDKKRARVLVAFLYPPADVVNEGHMEDSWAPNHWFTWPGNQFQPEAQEQKFTAKIREMGQSLGIDLEFAPRAIYQQAKVEAFIAQAKQYPARTCSMRRRHPSSGTAIADGSAARRLGLERVAATATLDRVGIVERESPPLDALEPIDGGSIQVQTAFLVDHHVHAVKAVLRVELRVEVAIETERIVEATATAASHPDPEKQIGIQLLFTLDPLDLVRRTLCHRNRHIRSPTVFRVRSLTALVL